MKTCGECQHWIRFEGETRGECFRYPPLPSVSGTMMRPRMRERERACGEFCEGNGGVKVKQQPDTHGDAIKARQVNFVNAKKK